MALLVAHIMVSVRVVQVLVSLASAIAVQGDYVNYLVTAPQNPLLEVGTKFTATCLITKTAEVTADDLSWKLGRNIIPKEQYAKINGSALNVTITITNETPQWLFCLSEKDSAHVKLAGARYLHGIFLRKGYLPEKPENLSCMAVQDKTSISPIIHCEWESKRQQYGDFQTIYRLNVNILNFNSFTSTTQESRAEINTEVFPNFMTLDIWVEAENELGKVESEHLTVESNSLIKTNPPANISMISEDVFPTTLLLNWTRPIHETHIVLIYEIRYTHEGSHNWSYVPQADTNGNIQSFRLQNLQPDVVYIAQVRCKNHKLGYWSEWSANSTKRTPSSKPESKPDLWQIISDSEATDERQVLLLSKEPELANGKIEGFELKIQENNKSAMWEPVTNPNADSSSRHITLLKQFRLAKITYIVKVRAFNSKGMSPEATMVIPVKKNGLAPVQELKVYPEKGKLFVEWSPPNSTGISEYVVQWANSSYTDWQRVTKHVRKTSIRGNLEKFVRYTVSVYPLYLGVIGIPTRTEAYLEQGAPLVGPSIKLNEKAGCNEAHLTWEVIPLHEQQGFITNYTIFYTDGTTRKAITVPNNTLSYTLTSLARNTRYDTWIEVSNIKGSKSGPIHLFTTLKYAPGEIEGIVVGVSLGFVFVVVLTMMICIYKRDVIKERLWPEIPNPGESMIGKWSPKYPQKAETPRENVLSDISLLDVDICDGKSVFEEDKACLPLKKDKYLSEEHSSGIGGSSCMSSPRQSVSDSDEGDIADTTASTVQYSSVVASSGYKGQTPSLQPQQAVFSRSESTQPLLESEENPDMLSLEGSRQSQSFPQLSFSHSEGSPDNTNQLEMEEQATLDFCPVGEDSEEITGQPDEFAPISTYMPQLGGYRHQ